MPKGKGPGAPYGNKNAAGPHKGYHRSGGKNRKIRVKSIPVVHSSKRPAAKYRFTPRGFFPTSGDLKLTAGAFLKKIGNRPIDENDDFVKIGTWYKGPYKPGYYKKRRGK